MDSPIPLRDVPAIVANYRQLVLSVFLYVLLSVTVKFVPLFFPFLLTVAAACVMFYAYRMAKALGSRAPWLWPIGMLLPFLNILGLLDLSSRASAVCRENGIEVGLLGPRKV